MQPPSVNRTAKIIKSIILMKGEELFRCKKKIKMLEKTLEDDYSPINIYRYKQANDRLNNFKSTILDLKMLELRINRNF